MTGRTMPFPTWKTLARSERRFALLVGLALVVITGLPLLYGWSNTPPDATFTGLQSINVGDFSVYASYIEQVREGRLLFVNRFTSDLPPFPRLHAFWLGMGLIATVLHLPAIVAFHAVRLVLIIPFVAFLAVFVTTFIERGAGTWSASTLRRIALLGIAFAAGFGGIVHGLTSYATHAPPEEAGVLMDLLVAEAFPFTAMYTSPHFIASLWLLLGIILLGYRYALSGHIRDAVLAGIAALALFHMQPYYVVTIFGVLAAWITIETIVARRIPKRLVALTVVVLLMGAPAIAYQLWLIHADPITVWHLRQNILPMPRWWVVLISYGALIPLATAGIVLRLRTMTRTDRLLIAWLVANVVLLVTPFPWQRKLSEGFQVALVLAGTPALAAILATLRAHLPQPIARYGWTRLTGAITAIVVFALSPITVVGADLLRYDPRNAHTPTFLYYFFYPNATIDAMHWIRAHADERDATVAASIDGYFVPRYAARPVAYGHMHETTNATVKRAALLDILMARMSPADALLLLRNLNVRYFLVTDTHRDVWVLHPTDLPGVHLAYANDGAEVYELAPPSTEETPR
ncbi:MAG: hypothetical protein Q7S96_04885 [bacterium]|nr:hypothetical protein [bacterium]